MRNLKKVLAAIIIVTIVLSTMMVSVFADENTTTAVTDKTAGEVCKDLGVLKGGANGVDSQYLATSTQRIQAAIIYLRMLGLEDEARAYVGTDNFTDASVVANVPGATNILAYLKANPELGWVGDGKKFSPTENVSAQQLYKVLLTVLGYEQGKDFDYSETLFFAKFIGMSQISKVSKLTNADLATALVEALKSPAKGATTEQGAFINTLIASGLIKADAAKADGFEVAEGLTIASVTAPDPINVEYGATPVLPATVEATMSDDSNYDAAVTWGAVDTTKEGAQVVHGTINGYEQGVDVTVNVAKQVLSVTGVSATNLKEIVVAFNKALDKDSAETAANYTLSAGTVSKATMDGNNVILTLTAAAAQQASVDVTVKNIKSAAGDTIADTTKTVQLLDNTVPQFNSVTVTGPKTVKVVFSEPLQTVPTFQVDNGNYYVANDFAAGAKEINLTFGVELSAGSHKITAKDGSDYAGFKVAETTISYDYATDATVPAVSVKSATETVVTLTFSKPVKATNINTDVTAYYSYNNDASYKGILAAVTPDVNGYATEYTATFATPIPSGNSTLYLNTKTDSLQDTWGNDVATTTLPISVVVDNVKPEVSKVTTDGDKKLLVTFSEDVQSVDAMNKTFYTLKNSAGTVLKTVDFADVDDNGHFNGNVGIAYDSITKVATITLTHPLSGAYVLTIEKMRDKAYLKNTMDAASISISVADATAPTLASAYVNSDNKKIRVIFSEAMSTTGLTTTSNYRLSVNGAASIALPDYSTVTIVDNKTVEITLPAAIANFDGAAGDKVQANGTLCDLVGNAIGSFYGEATVGTDSINLVDDTAKATAKNTITFQVDKELSAIDASQFSSVNGAGRTVASAYYVNDSGKSTVTVIFNGDLNSDLSNFTSLTVGANALTNVFGTKNLAFSMDMSAVDGTAHNVVADTVAPSIVSVTTVDTTHIAVLFSEPVDPSTISKYTFTVAGSTVTGVVLSNANKTATLALKDAIDAGAKPALTQALNVEDVTANVLAAGTTVIATDDGIAPAISSVVLNAYSGANNSTLTVTFAEAIDDSTIAAADFTLGGSGLNGAAISSIATGDYANDNTIVITLDKQLTPATGEQITVTPGAGSYKDANGLVNVDVTPGTYTK